MVSATLAGQNLFMVPVVDMLNHSSSCNAELRTLPRSVTGNSNDALELPTFEVILSAYNNDSGNPPDLVLM